MSNKKQIPKRRKLSITQIVYYIILIITSIIVLIPFIWMISTSLDKVQSYGLPYPPRLIPENFSFYNYEIAMQNMPVMKYMTNTVIIATLTVVLNVILSTVSGFCISKGNFLGKSFITIFLLFNMMIPFETKLLPTYNIVHSMGLTNNLLGVVLPVSLTSAVYIFFAKKYCDDLPSDLYEAGIVDGAGKFTIYTRIYLPLMRPCMATIAILTVIASWNDLLWPMVVLTQQDLRTIQVGLAQLATIDGIMHAGTVTAMSVISILPLCIIFIFLQRFIVESIAASGIKG